MTENWKSYLCNVHNKIASSFVNLDVLLEKGDSAALLNEREIDFAQVAADRSRAGGVSYAKSCYQQSSWNSAKTQRKVLGVRRALIATMLLALLAVPALAQQHGTTWDLAKPVVDGWVREYESAGRTVAARDRMLAAIQHFLGEHPSEIWAYEAAAIGYNSIDRNAEAVGVMRDYVQRFPTDMALADRVLFFFGNWGTPEDMETLPAQWKQRLDYWRWLLRVYARSDSAPRLLQRAGTEILRRLPAGSDEGGNQRFTIAELWLQHGVDAHAAERVAREAVEIAELGKRPDSTAPTAESRKITDRLIIRNVNRSALGWALFHQRRYSEALVELSKAAAIAEREDVNSRGVYYRLGQTLEKLNRPNEALDAYFKELAWGDYTNPSEAAIEVAYRQLHGNLDGLEVVRRQRLNDLIAKRAERASDLVRDTDEDLGRFDLLDGRGRVVDLKRYGGKLVIIDFWASWCTSCMASMEQTARLQREHSDSIVVIAPCLDAEETHASATQLLRDKSYDFVLVFDEESRRSIRLPFIPAQLVLDRNGRLRVEHFGYTPESAALFEQKILGLLRSSE